MPSQRSAGQVAIKGSQRAVPSRRRRSSKARSGSASVSSATRGETEYGICSTAFLEHAFLTESYKIEVGFHANGNWSYVQDTMLRVKGYAEPFAHRDHNILHKVAEPKPNPLALASG